MNEIVNIPKGFTSSPWAPAYSNPRTKPNSSSPATVAVDRAYQDSFSATGLGEAGAGPPVGGAAMLRTIDFLGSFGISGVSAAGREGGQASCGIESCRRRA